MRLAVDRPTKASSTAEGSSSANVTDGKADTAWCPGPTDQAPWIQVDLENTYTLTRVQLTFSEHGTYHYLIAVSANGKDWKTVSDQSHSTEYELVRTAAGDFGSGLRFLRVTFTELPKDRSIGLAEITVDGKESKSNSEN